MNEKRRTGDCAICGEDILFRNGRWEHVTTYGDSMHPPKPKDEPKR